MIEYTRHARTQMADRGVSEIEVAIALTDGYDVNVRYPRKGRRKVFTSGYVMHGRSYPHMELTVVYAEEGELFVIVTVIARYGMWEQSDENNL